MRWPSAICANTYTFSLESNELCRTCWMDFRITHSLIAAKAFSLKSCYVTKYQYGHLLGWNCGDNQWGFRFYVSDLTPVHISAVDIGIQTSIAILLLITIITKRTDDVNVETDINHFRCKVNPYVIVGSWAYVCGTQWRHIKSKRHAKQLTHFVFERISSSSSHFFRLLLALRLFSRAQTDKLWKNKTFYCFKCRHCRAVNKKKSKTRTRRGSMVSNRFAATYKFSSGSSFGPIPLFTSLLYAIDSHQCQAKINRNWIYHKIRKRKGIRLASLEKWRALWLHSIHHIVRRRWAQMGKCQQWPIRRNVNWKLLRFN